MTIDSIIAGGIENRRKEVRRLVGLMIMEIENCNFGLATKWKTELSEQIDILFNLKEQEKRLRDDLRTR